MKKIIFHFNLSAVFILIFPILLQFTVIESSLNLFSQTKDKCTVQLDSAQQAYDIGNFTEAINLIESCLSTKELSEIDKITAYRLLGLVYIADNLKKEADNAVRNLLIMVPNYKSDPEKDPPSLKRIIDEITPTLIPQITSITPNSVDQKGDGFTMTVSGSNFVYGSKVNFGGKARQTTFISENELKADIPSSDLLKEGVYEITVYSPIAKGITSVAEKFEVKPSSSFPWTWVAAGAGAVAAAVAIILLGGDDTPPPTTLADPPGRP